VSFDAEVLLMKAVKNIKGLAVAARGLMLLVVFAAIVFIVTATMQEMIRMHLSRNKHPVPATKTELTEEQKHDKIVRSARRNWLADGTMHLVHYSGGTMYGFPGERSVEIYDTEVNLLWSGPEEEKPYSYLSGPGPYGRWHGFPFMGTEFTIEFSRSLVVPVVSGEKVKVENWRYMPSGEYFTGYNQNGERIGYLGADGFWSEKDKVNGLGKLKWADAWSSRDSYTPKMIWHCEKVLWQIDFEQREVEKLYEFKDGTDYFRLFGWRALDEQESPMRRAIAVFEKEGCHLVIDNPREVITIKLAAEYSKIYHSINILRGGDEFYVRLSGMKGAPVDKDDRAAMVKWLEETRGKPRDIWQELHRLKGSGELELLGRNEWTNPVEVGRKTKSSWERAEEFKKYTTSAAPVFFMPIGKWRLEERNKYRADYGNFVRGVDEIVIYTAPTNMFYCLVLSFVSVCGAAYHGISRRLSVAGLIGWLVFVGIFNVAGLLTYLAMNHKPVFRCSACGKKRHLIGDICIRCGRGLAVPERKETDLVFAG
jgi:hypothetical protein